ncbi:MAG: response regulator transcription factor [Burkholderiales bacterium]
MLRIAAIDDHQLILDGIRHVLDGLAADGKLGFEFHLSTFLSMAAFEAAVAGTAVFDYVLLDLGLPGHHGLSALERYRSLFADTSVVVLSAHDDPATVLAALERGAMGFIPKSSTREALEHAIRVTASGQLYTPTQALHQAGMTEIDRWEMLGRRQPAGSSLYDCPALEGLTLRQRDVLGLLVKGLPNKLICRNLGLSENTVKTHLAAVFGVLGVHSRTQALLRVQQLGVRLDLHRPGAAHVGDPR